MKRYACIESPLGVITIQVNDEGVLGVWFESQTTQPEQLGSQSDDCPIINKVKQQLDEYFSRQRTSFDLPLAAQGTKFQTQVWHALTTIPYGTSISYQELAERIGNPKAVRAVGLANGKNPISIIVPCHRVIGKNGKLTGYAGGMDRKMKLLKLEGVME
ncbi:methylated-DNA--[protein]-cysteine S-methyltransferase [Vibrio sp. S4M6]|uniref:methylated-DNA--[protein]-cysteine S-methyltransferase n=1 Tax=Vibrio sinus TaxID=2946865 RepID=UPI00202AAD5A|nr:methylated-DNA--[protein]-cysteine S-methyltransferase [Vibrio sinus]MCL9780154.1 methylated-DNA--[protein]-cysteine S-methyltransferase [Vibrio sinus]